MEYKIDLPEFEGPLDLLLHLIKKDNINIQDIYNILGTYGIERREYLEKLVRTLQNVRDKAISTATDNKSVGLILSKKSE